MTVSAICVMLTKRLSLDRRLVLNALKGIGSGCTDPSLGPVASDD
jgi:hypothetical protein